MKCFRIKGMREVDGTLVKRIDHRLINKWVKRNVPCFNELKVKISLARFLLFDHMLQVPDEAFFHRVVVKLLTALYTLYSTFILK